MNRPAATVLALAASVLTFILGLIAEFGLLLAIIIGVSLALTSGAGEGSIGWDPVSLLRQGGPLSVAFYLVIFVALLLPTVAALRVFRALQRRLAISS